VLGESTVQVSQPRGPCYKIAARWGHKTLPDLMAKAGTSGFYLRVLEEGEVRPGDHLTLVDRRSVLTVAEVMRVTYRDRRDREALNRAISVPELATGWRTSLEKMLGRTRRPSRPAVRNGSGAGRRAAPYAGAMLEPEERLAELGLALPPTPEPTGSFVTSHPDLSLTEAYRIVVVRVEFDRLGTVEVRA
jgi:hypothetical protein